MKTREIFAFSSEVALFSLAEAIITSEGVPIQHKETMISELIQAVYVEPSTAIGNPKKTWMLLRLSIARSHKSSLTTKVEKPS